MIFKKGRENFIIVLFYFLWKGEAAGIKPNARLFTWIKYKIIVDWWLLWLAFEGSSEIQK